jgi:anthranilate phosphoribosyltransferase
VLTSQRYGRSAGHFKTGNPLPRLTKGDFYRYLSAASFYRMTQPSLSPLERAIHSLANRESLSETMAAEAFAVVMDGAATPAQIGSLLLGLRAKGETVDEVTGAARALRAAMRRVEFDAPHLVDTAGTGGGAVTTFNISSGAALVAAGAGATVAKHGNRSYTSRCGSAEVFEALGVPIDLDAIAAARALREAGIAFLFAPNFHPAMRHAAPVRKALGVGTILNLLGPLANPAGVRRQVVGVADRARGPQLAEALLRLGAEHALVVHGRVGMDEVSPVGATEVWEARDGRVTSWTILPDAFGLGVADGTMLGGALPRENAVRLERLLDGAEDIAGRAAVVLNAGAALYAAGLADSYGEGVDRAQDALRSGAAREALVRMRRIDVSTSE